MDAEAVESPATQLQAGELVPLNYGRGSSGAAPQVALVWVQDDCTSRPSALAVLRLITRSKLIVRSSQSPINAPKITSDGTSRSDVHGTSRNVVRSSSYNNGAARPVRRRERLEGLELLTKRLLPRHE
jgi:hypothetical protein